MRNALRPLRAAARLAAAWAPVLMVEAMLLAGPVAIAYGAWLASPPAGYIVAGLELIAIGWILAKRSA